MKTKNKVGDFHENPFEFKRKWEIPSNSSLKTAEGTEREKFLENRIRQIEEQFQKFQASIESQKGKGRGKKSKTTTSTADVSAKDLSEQINKEAEKRLRSFLQTGILNS